MGARAAVACRTIAGSTIPAFWNIVLYDQRGAGRSTPAAELADNTTQHLVADLERLREELKFERWLVFGGSWGSTLALAYAQAHPDRVLGLVLRGIFLATAAEIDWFMHGMRNVFPEAWRAFVEALPAGERTDLLASYYRRLTDRDPARHLPAARAWDRYEGACTTLLPVADPLGRFDGDAAALAIARIEAHYFVNQGFLAPNQLQRWRGEDPPPSLRDRAGPLRHRLPARHGRRAGARVAGSRVRCRAGRRAFGARTRNHAGTGGGGEADAGAHRPKVARSARGSPSGLTDLPAPQPRALIP